MGRFPTGVTVVTALDGTRPAGITVNSICPVSVDPPLLMISIDRRRTLTPVIHRTRAFAVNVLRDDQQSLSMCFAGAPTVAGRADFCGAPWHPGETGLPLLDDALAALACEVVLTRTAGDHDLFVARVVAITGAESDGSPLLYHRGHYAQIGIPP
jgi:flavin reductase (DIM6/NTAB) family NADH-FMN oxidoreductase RutF